MLRTNSSYANYREWLRQRQDAIRAAAQEQSAAQSNTNSAIGSIGQIRNIGNALDERRDMGPVYEQRALPGLIYEPTGSGPGYEPNLAFDYFARALGKPPTRQLVYVDPPNQLEIPLENAQNRVIQRVQGPNQRPAGVATAGSARVLRAFPQGVEHEVERPRSREANRGIRPLMDWSRDSVNLTDGRMTRSQNASTEQKTRYGATRVTESHLQRMIEAANGGVEPEFPSQPYGLVEAVDELRRSPRRADDYEGDPADFDPNADGAGALQPRDRDRARVWDLDPATGQRIALADDVYIDSKGRPVRQSPDVVDTMAAYSVVEVPYLGVDGKIRRQFVRPGETAAVIAPATGSVRRKGGMKAPPLTTVQFGGKTADADASAPWDRTLDVSQGGLVNEARSEARTPTISGWGIAQAAAEGRFTPVPSAEEGGPIQGSTKLIGYLTQPAQRPGRDGKPPEAIEVWDYGGKIQDLRVEPGRDRPELVETGLYRLGNKMSTDTDAFREIVRQSPEMFPGMGQATKAFKVSPRVVTSKLSRGELAVVMENDAATDPSQRFSLLSPAEFEGVMQDVQSFAERARSGGTPADAPNYRLYAVPPGTDPQALQSQRVPGQMLNFYLPPSGAQGRSPVQITLGDPDGPVYVGPSDFADNRWERKAGEKRYGTLFDRLNDLTPGKFMEDAPIIAPSTLSRRLLQVGADRRQARQGGMQSSEILKLAAQSGAGPTEMRDLERALISASNDPARPVAPLVVADQEALRGAYALESMERAAATMLAEVPDVEVVRAIAESQLPPEQKALASRALANVLARRSEDPERFAEENFELIQQDLNRLEEQYAFDPRENAGVGDVDSGEMITLPGVRSVPGARSERDLARNLGYEIETTGDLETAQLAAAARDQLMNPGFLSEGRVKDDVTRQALYLADAARRAGGASARPTVARTAAAGAPNAGLPGRTLEQLLADAQALAGAPVTQVREPLVGGQGWVMGGGPGPTVQSSGLPFLTTEEVPQFAWNVARNQRTDPIRAQRPISGRDALVNATWQAWAPGLKPDQFANALSGQAGWDAVLKAQQNQALRLAAQYGRTFGQGG